MSSHPARTFRYRYWGTALRTVLLPLGDLAFGQRLTTRLAFLAKAQWWDREKLEHGRRLALAKLIGVAYREVPFYRDLFDKARVQPGEISTIEALRRVPFVTKEMLRSRYPAGTTRATGQRTYEACSSGSTGLNFCVREDPETAGWYRASFMLALEWSGWRLGEPHLQTGMTLQRTHERRWKDLLLRCHYVSAADLTDKHLDECLARIEKHRLNYVWGYPGSLYFLARRAAQLNWNRPLRSMVTWGDMLHPHWRREIETVFRTRVFDTYGCGEGIQVAAQCGEGLAYHVHDLDVIVEYVDEEGRPVPVGRPGNILLTRLHPGPMPLIRYAVGDSGIAPNGEHCRCGRGFSTMGPIEGRRGDVVLTPSGNRLIVHFFTGVLEHFLEIANFQVVQEEPDRLILRVVPGEGFSREILQRVLQRLRAQGLTDMTIDMEVVSEIPIPPSQKHRFIISKLAVGQPAREEPPKAESTVPAAARSEV